MAWALVAGLVGAEAPAAESIDLRVEGRIRHVVAADFDHDGRRDLLVLHIEGRGLRATRRASIFLQASEGPAFAANPSLDWQLPADEALLDVADDGSGDALFGLRRDGVYRYRLGPAITADRVVAADLSTVRPELDDILVSDFARRWHGAELAFLAPTLPEPILMTRCASGGYGVTALPVEPDAYYLSDDLGRELPSLRVLYDADLPASSGDERQRLVFYRRERLLTLRPPAPGECPRRVGPAEVHPVDIREPDDDAWEPQVVLTRLVDVDGDGRTDLVAIAFRDSGLLELDGSVMIFRARADGSYPSSPDQRLGVENGQYYLTYLENTDGRGPLEVVMPTASIGVFGFIKLLTRRKVSFRFHTFDASDDGVYGEARAVEPQLSALVSDRFDIATATLADVTGDGLLDLVMAPSKNRVCLHRGIRGARGWELGARPALCFDGDAFAHHRLADLDGDGRAELLMIGVREQRRRELRVVYLDGRSD